LAAIVEGLSDGVVSKDTESLELPEKFVGQSSMKGMSDVVRDKQIAKLLSGVELVLATARVGTRISRLWLSVPATYMIDYLIDLIKDLS
jgi:hypothetical protein